MSIDCSRINTSVGWGQGLGTERSACPGLHAPVGARNTTWKLLPGLPVLAGELGSGVKSRDPPAGSLSRPENDAPGEDIYSASVSQQQKIFFPSRKTFPIPSALSCDFSFVLDTSSSYLPSRLHANPSPKKAQLHSQEGIQGGLHLSPPPEPLQAHS